jgi:hypothetical protein
MAARGVDLTTSGRCTFCSSLDWKAEWWCADGATVRVCLVCAIACLPKLIIDALPIIGLGTAASLLPRSVGH